MSTPRIAMSTPRIAMSTTLSYIMSVAVAPKRSRHYFLDVQRVVNSD